MRFVDKREDSAAVQGMQWLPVSLAEHKLELGKLLTVLMGWVEVGEPM